MRLLNRINVFLLGLFLQIIAVGAFAQNSCEEAIHLNQVGFFSAGEKLAILASKNRSSQNWQLLASDGKIIASGKTSVYGDDKVSGQFVHRIGFNDVTQSGDGFVLKSGCAQSHPFTIGREIYAQLKEDALIYFYLNRAGVAIEERFVGKQHARPAGHGNEVVSCRSGKDSKGNIWPGCDYSLNVTGGWYDAGDQGKYVVNGGISTWTLQNLYELMSLDSVTVVNTSAFADNGVGENSGRLPESGNGFNDLLDEARFEMEFMLSMQAPAKAKAKVPVNQKEPAENLTFTDIDASYMAHHKVADENWTALPTLPHEDKQKRVLFPVTTAATLNLAATAAQCARLWKGLDDAFTTRCLNAAEQAYAAAEKNPTVYFTADFTGSGHYGDTDLSDEFFWAAAELFATTGKNKYRLALENSPVLNETIDTQSSSWRQVEALGKITLSLLKTDLPTGQVKKLQDQIIKAAKDSVAEQDKVGYAIPYSSEKYFWGSNSDVLNRALISSVAYLLTNDDKFLEPASNTMDYLLGRNPLDQSYISGYGENPMLHPHHRAWAHSLGDAPPPPAGALSGGPNNSNGSDPVMTELLKQNCAPQMCWQDHVEAYALNEVAINWNAPLVWVVTFLDGHYQATKE